jgi:DNA-binding NtrC family response regulator
MSSPWGVVLVSADLEHRRNVAAMLASQAVDPVCLPTVQQCRETLSKRKISLVFSDYKLPDGTFVDVLAAAVEAAFGAPKVVLMSAKLTLHEYDQAKCSGAFDIIPTPCRPTDIEWMVILARRADVIRPKPLCTLSTPAQIKMRPTG